MYARTSTWTGTPEALDSWVRHVTDKVGPMIAGLPDNGGAYFFIDQDQGRARLRDPEAGRQPCHA